MRDLQTVIDQYFEAWNEPEQRARLALIQKAWAVNGRYCDL